MNARPLALTIALLALAALLPTPHVRAGTLQNPEITDGQDDVEVNGGANCQEPSTVPGGPCVFGTGNDFNWPNSDLKYLWFNDTPEALHLALQMKSGNGFTAGSEGPFADLATPTLGKADKFDYDYAFHFTIDTVAYTATAHFDSAGVMSVGGVASGFVVVANNLYLTIPWANIGNPASGDIVHALTATSHGKGATSGITLDDHAPDANVGADYPIENGSAAAPTGNGTGEGTLVSAAVTNATLSVQHAFNATTSATYGYNWSAAPARVQLQAASAGNGTDGTARVVIQDGAHTTLYNHTFGGSLGDSAVLSGVAANWTVDIHYTNFTGSFVLTLQPASATASSSSSSHAASSRSASQGAAATGTHSQSQTTTTASKGSPSLGLPLLAVAVVALALALRRRVA